LNNLKEHPDAWTRVDTILEFSQNQQTKYYALQILEKTIKTKWKALPRNQCEAIKKYIVGLIIKNSSDQIALEKEKVYLNKLNIILIQVSFRFIFLCVYCERLQTTSYDFVHFRYWNMNGPKIGPHSSVILLVPVSQTSRCVKTTWKYWNYWGFCLFFY
jgi:hypothetical protein